MKFSKICSILIPAGLGLVLSCQRESFEVEYDNRESLTKVISFAEDCTREKLLVKFSSVPSDGQLRAVVSSDIESIAPLFTKTKGKEELEKQFGLDRWFELTLAEDADFDRTVSSLASLSQVSAVELCSKVSKASDCIAHPYFCDGGTKVSTPVPGLDFNDPALSSQWHYINNGDPTFASNAYPGADINVRDTWSLGICGDPSIIVAVVDDGVKHTHPDLSANMWTNEAEANGIEGVDDDGNGFIDDIYGYNFCTDNGRITRDAAEDTGHGTHCAGIIAAVNNNGTGVCGIAGGSGKSDGCRIMSCQIFSGASGGTTDIVTKAIKYAADMGASVISCSFEYAANYGSDKEYISKIGSAEIDALRYFEASAGNNSVLDGNIAIFAAGNNSHPNAHYPGAFHEIIAVSSFAPDFLPTFYTNYGPGCNISAPGGEYALTSVRENSEVLSTLVSEVNKSDYGYMQGTSMACPHVAGVVALALSHASELGHRYTVERFKQMILSSVNDMDGRISSFTTKSYYKNYMYPLLLKPFEGNMGSGAIDCWHLMMQVEGIPCIIAKIGEKQGLDISDYFGSSANSLSFYEVSVDEKSRESLGLAEAPYVEGGLL
ncbi:MAG: S8 family serine peptidase, partial [Candidatus Cryptobacteroides sp.]